MVYDMTDKEFKRLERASEADVQAWFKEQLESINDDDELNALEKSLYSSMVVQQVMLLNERRLVIILQQNQRYTAEARKKIQEINRRGYLVYLLTVVAIISGLLVVTNL